MGKKHYYRVIKNNKGNFTHCHPVWTPVYTRWMRFPPSSRPPNFYGFPLQSTTGTCFFTFLFFWHKNTKNHKKSQKTLAFFYIFAFISFFMNRKKLTFLQKQICTKIAIRMLWTRIVTSDFRVEKKREKTCKKHVF